MARIQLQFHGAPDELVELAKRWATDHGVTVVAERFFPDYTASAIVDLAQWAPSEEERPNRIAICLDEPDTDAPSAHDFVARNPGCLFLSVGSLGESGLRESAIDVEGDTATMQTWRDLVGQARSAMHAGAFVRNPATGAEMRVPDHLYTDGARALAREGVTMLAAAGWNEFKFDDRG